MTKITSLADEIRSRIAQPPEPAPPPKPKAKKKDKLPDTEILLRLKAYDNTDHKNLVHVRLDEQTARMLNHFKMATGVDVTRLMAFSVKQLFETHPELKDIIKQFIQNMSL